ncbi:MAG: bifunctional homocysteine S-methyltransferase/methylenetetrahydrofolate reductase [Dehalococcoidia bacterium]|nr:bifunctional homocysteine S-methyltransferase/methylenetetrahydrofolate reductase [Dehalococcoidia bacterium]
MTTAPPQAASRQRSRFLEALSLRVIVADGAIGTMLQERGVPIDACLEQVNISRPALVRTLHREYVEAGAELIQTNTFGANRVRLAAFSLEGRVAEINRRAVQIAREAVALTGRGVFIAGDVGPLGEAVAPEEAQAAFEEQIGSLAQEHVDLLLIETFSSLEEAMIAIAAARKAAPGTPVVVEMSFLVNGRTAEGRGARETGEALIEAGADVIGVNCGEGPPQALRLLKELARIPGARLIAQPNAGKPQLVQRRVVYTATADYIAGYAKRFVRAGALIVGGCCGTSPRHIAAMREALDQKPAPDSVSVEIAPTPLAPEPVVARSFQEKLKTGRFVVSVEVDPPRSQAVVQTIEAARLMREAGADCVNVGDSPMAEARLSAIAMASLLKEKAGIEPVLHCSTRDRNLMALQSDLLGAHALGIRSVLCIKGDAHALGSYAKATAIWDLNAFGLLRLLRGFNAGEDAAGKPVRPSTSFFAGAAVNPSAPDLVEEAKMVRRKAQAGAEFLISQAVFEAEAVERLIERLGPSHPPIIIGVWPVHSLRQADFLSEYITPVPSWVRDRIEAAGSDAEKAGVEMAQDLLEKLRPLAQGVYLIPSFGRFSGIAELVVAARELADSRA